MARLKTNFANEAPYSLAHGIALGRAFGLSEAQIAAIGTDAGMSSPVFTPRERAALQWAACVAHNTAKHRDDVFEELKTHYNDAEIVELTGLCALANMMDRFHNALRIPLETPAEIEALNRSPWIDPAAIRTYLQTILASWPQELPVPVAA